MTTGADNRQGVFDFSAVLGAEQKRKRPHKVPNAVPKERTKILADVRIVWGIKLKDIAAISDLDTSFLSRVLTLKQDISLSEFQRLKSALADIVFEKSLKAAGVWEAE